MVGAEPLERRRLTANAGCDLVFPARQHETDGSQAPGQFLRGIDSRDRVRMQPRRARRGRDEHHDRPYKAVKHATSQGKTDAVTLTRAVRPVSGGRDCWRLRLRRVRDKSVTPPSRLEQR